MSFKPRVKQRSDSKKEEDEEECDNGEPGKGEACETNEEWSWLGLRRE